MVPIDGKRDREIYINNAKLRDLIERSPELVSPVMRALYYDVNYLQALVDKYREAEALKK